MGERKQRKGKQQAGFQPNARSLGAAISAGIYDVREPLWPVLTLHDLIDRGDAELQTGPFGTMLHAKAYTKDGIPVVAVKNIGDNRLLDDDIPRVDQVTALRLERYRLLAGDIIFGRKGAVDRRALVKPAEEGWLQGSDCIRLRLNQRNIHPRFISFVLGASSHRAWITQQAHGATMPSLNQEILSRLPLPVPAFEEQEAIAEILGTLDDKIELNRKMNETLEEMARALFKSWFVDFDPVRAKAEGRDPSLPAPIAAFFPDSFEDSELGEIPKGWSVAAIRDVASNIQYGLTASAQAEGAGPKFLRITDIQGGRVDWSKVPYCNAPNDKFERYQLKPHDIFVARTGASTGENIYLPVVPDAVFASYLVRFQFREPAHARVTGAFMRSNAYFEYVQNSIGGSAQPNASAQVLAGARFVMPPLNLCREVAEILAPFDLNVWQNLAESEILSELRNTLLPKFISGELRVQSAEQLAEAAI